MSDCMLKQTLTEAMKTAMREQNKARLAVIRLMLAAVKQKEVDSRLVLSDSDVLVILDKMVKQRRESIKHYEAGQRQDLVAQEKFEIEVIQEFLPKPLDEAVLEQLVKAAVTKSGATSMQDMGKVMTLLKPDIQGRADLSRVSVLIKNALGGP